MKIKILEIRLEEEEVKVRTSDYREFRKYLSKGFFVYDRDNGFYILKRGTKIWVTIVHNRSCSVIDIQKILSQYYKEENNKKLYNFFKRDLKKKKVELTLDSNGYCVLIEK